MDEAKKSGLLPHEWLLQVARGEPVLHHVINAKGKYEETLVYPPMDMRIDAAKAAAPYYAPKLAIKLVNPTDPGNEIAAILNSLADKLPGA